MMEDEGQQKNVEVGREKVSMFKLITVISLNVRRYVCVCFFFFLLHFSVCYIPPFVIVNNEFVIFCQ